MTKAERLDRLMISCGLRDSLIGSEYIRMAVDIYAPQMSITKELYPAIAAAANTTPSRVERAIRHAIETGFERCGWDNDVLEMFGNTVDPNRGKPTNSELIARLARLCGAD